MKAIGTAIKNLRLSASVSQSELAKAIGITSSRLSYIESGKEGITLKNLENICNFFGIKLSEFIKEIEE